MKHKIISIKQPWAHLICAGAKDIENRSWKCPQKYIGKRILIHASAKSAGEPYTIFTDEQYKAIEKAGVDDELAMFNSYKEVSRIIGSVIIAGCVQNHPSIWAIKGYWHWTLKDPILFEKPILNIKGKLGLWDYEV